MSPFFLLLALYLPNSSPGAALPAGLCPFEEKSLTAFEPDFREEFGDDYITSAFQRRERWYGPCSSSSLGKNRYLLRYGEASFPLELSFAGKKISHFAFGDPKIENDTWAKLISLLEKEWGESSLWVGTPSEVLASHRAEEEMYIGESRNLLLAAALAREIQSGKIKAAEKIELRQEDKAQETDDLAEEKPGKKFSLSDLKRRMFSRFDRTAADLLMKRVGHSALEKGHADTAPFLSRREYAWLMALPNEKMAALKRSDARAKAAALNKKTEIPPIPQERYDHFSATEWKGRAKELCDAMREISSWPEFKEGLPSRNFRLEHPKWKNGRYHAARDFGIAQTTWIAIPQGRKEPVCVSMNLNLPGFLDEGVAQEILVRAFALFGRE